MKKFTEFKEEIINEAVSSHMKNGIIAKAVKAIGKEISNLDIIIGEFEKKTTSKHLPVPDEYVDFQMASVYKSREQLYEASVELNKLLK